MSTQKSGIYLFVEFDWPRPFTQEQGKMAYQLHQLLQDQDWIKEVVAASGGIGERPSSIWVFWLENYAALDRLLRHQEDEIGKAYVSFFSEMPIVKETIREEVIFL
jgi:hypothetical protein